MSYFFYLDIGEEKKRVDVQISFPALRVDWKNYVGVSPSMHHTGLETSEKYLWASKESELGIKESYETLVNPFHTCKISKFFLNYDYLKKKIYADKFGK